MNRVSATFRLTVGLISLTMSALFVAQTMGFVPDRYTATVAGRTALCEAMAINCSLFASRGDAAQMEAAIRAIAERNPELLSAGIRRQDGQLLIDVGNHASQWRNLTDRRSTDSAIVVPITANSQLWGTVEVRFQPLRLAGIAGFVWHPVTRLAAFLSLLTLPIYFYYLRIMLQHLDPSKVIPDRVRAALDTLSGGLLVLDKDERIVLANKSFANTVGMSAEQLQGLRASQLPWVKKGDHPKSGQNFPWAKSLAEGASQTGVMLGISSGVSDAKTFLVNSAPILSDQGVCRGALTSFDDVTQLENSRAELSRMLDLLKASREEIHRQNEELKILATKDPLTSCLNRRSFLSQFEVHWNSARRYDHPLSCIMVDVDHFKSINDNHGHAVGDQVLQKVAAILAGNVREGDLVCRYGGEEFAILLPHLDIQGAKCAAERFRRAIQSGTISGLSVTASLGVSSNSLGAKEPQELLNEADKCMYVAKRNGRNQVISWNEVPDDLVIDESSVSRTKPPAETDTEVAIPFHAVTALISALAYRDQATAEHSRRVADLCVAAANGLMSVSDAYVLEIAALLHDIGKIGVPDSILLKPGPLTEEEWKVMQLHDRIGVEIIRSTFGSKELAETMRAHHSWFGGRPKEAGLPTGLDIPLSARILTIADAFDAMVSDRVYRKGRTQEAAFAELRRCAGTQFDPELVEHFIQIVRTRNRSEHLPESRISKQTALNIGLQIERLASAVDQQDFTGLKAMAYRLKATATKGAVPQIAELADKLEQALNQQSDLVTIIGLTTDLLTLCRSTHSCYVSNRAVHDSPLSYQPEPTSLPDDAEDEAVAVSGSLSA